MMKPQVTEQHKKFLQTQNNADPMHKLLFYTHSFLASDEGKDLVNKLDVKNTFPDVHSAIQDIVSQHTDILGQINKGSQ